MNDEIELPDLPAIVNDTQEDNPYELRNMDFEAVSAFDLTPKIDSSQLIESDFAHLTLNSLEQKVLVSELADCSMYLRNIHKGFKHVTSTKSLISLVAAGIGVQKHRRQILKEVKDSKAAIFELDVNGNPLR